MKHVSFIHHLCTMSLVLVIGSIAAADELIPATSEDLAQFDQQLAKQAPTSGAARPAAPDNFGKKVSAEAHKLNSQDPSQMKKFGKWVKSQRQQDDQSHGGAGMGMDRDGSSGAPGMPTNGSAFPGNSGRHRDTESHGNGKGNGNGNGNGNGHH